FIAGAAVPSSSTVNRYELESCAVAEYSDGSVVLDAPDCVCRRLTQSDGSYRWQVGWKWLNGEAPDYICCPEQYSINHLSNPQRQALFSELDSWIERGWLVPVRSEELCKIRCVLPLVPVVQSHKSTAVRPTIDYTYVNRFCTIASDPFAGNCQREIRRWRRVADGNVLDISRAYPSLLLDPEQSWYQVIRLDHRSDGPYFRLCRLGFGASSAPRILKSVLDFCLKDEPTKNLRYFDDILIPKECDNRTNDALHDGVSRVRSILLRNSLTTKDPCPIEGSRLLGLVVYRDDDKRLCWKRRLSLDELLHIEAKLNGGEAVSCKAFSSWVGTLSSHVPVCGWLRVASAIGRRLIGRECDSTKASWFRDIPDGVRRYGRLLCKLLRARGDPATGPWLLPAPHNSTKTGDLTPVKVWFDASTLAIGVVLTTSDNQVLYDYCALTPESSIDPGSRPSAHANIRELDALLKAVEVATEYEYTNVQLITDSKSVYAWVSKLLLHKKISVHGLHKPLIVRRLELLRRLVSEFRLRLTIIIGAHEETVHGGVLAVVGLIGRYYSWPAIRSDVEHELRRCSNEECEKNKAKLLPLVTSDPRRLSSGPWVTCASDVTHIDGRPVLTLICEYSRYALVSLLLNEQAVSVWSAFVRMCKSSLIGYPVFLRADRGVWSALRGRLNTVGTTLVLTSSYRPTSNGICERFNATLKTKCSVLPDSSLAVRLSRACSAYNLAPHSALNGASPAEVLSGREIRRGLEQALPVPPPAVAEESIKFDIGDQVWLAKPKEQRRTGARFFDSRYVIEEVSPYAYRVRPIDENSLPRGRQIVAAADRLIRCRQRLPIDHESVVSVSPSIPLYLSEDESIVYPDEPPSIHSEDAEVSRHEAEETIADRVIAHPRTHREPDRLNPSR
ncbi:hypothetical protein FOZ63_026119, partial [Perkinsus olseni]